MTQALFRFAPSPNGKLHLGHAYSALLNQKMARAVGGIMYLLSGPTRPCSHSAQTGSWHCWQRTFPCAQAASSHMRSSGQHKMRVIPHGVGAHPWSSHRTLLVCSADLAHQHRTACSAPSKYRDRRSTLTLLAVCQKLKLQQLANRFRSALHSCDRRSVARTRSISATAWSRRLRLGSS